MKMLAKPSAYFAKKIIEREQGPSQNDKQKPAHIPSANTKKMSQKSKIDIQKISQKKKMLSKKII